jgi:hypothetical protein
MGAGTRNGFDEYVGGFDTSEYSDDFGNNSVSTNRRRKKTRKRNKSAHKSYSRRKRHKISHVQRRKKAGHRKTKGGKRPYPTWLKKYWFKKGHKK